jgi:CBS domain-containing protein
MKRKPVTITESATVREAIDLMVAEGVGRLPVVKPGDPGRVTGIVTRSDILEVYGKHQRKAREVKRTIQVESFLPGSGLK